MTLVRAARIQCDGDTRSCQEDQAASGTLDGNAQRRKG
jgi:hypothetical protein